MVRLDSASGHAILSVVFTSVKFGSYIPFSDGTGCSTKDSDGQYRNNPAEGVFSKPAASA